MNINNCLKEKLLNEIFRETLSIILFVFNQKFLREKTRMIFSIISIEYL